VNTSWPVHPWPDVSVTHVLLDAFTSYGPQLFWPMTTPAGVDFQHLIIDPLYISAAALRDHGLVMRAEGKGCACNYAALTLSNAVPWPATLVSKQMAAIIGPGAGT